MKLTLLLLSAFVGAVSFGKQVTVSVTEITFERVADATQGTHFKTLQKHMAFAVDTEQLAVTGGAIFRDHKVASITKYSISDRKLICESHPLMLADRILYQGLIEGRDFVVIQTSRVSFNPLYWFSAISGHPIQFGDILVLSFAPDGKMKMSRLIEGSKAADWRAEVYEKAPNQAPTTHACHASCGAGDRASGTRGSP